MIEEEIELVMSSLCQTIRSGNQDFAIEIYNDGKSDWVLEVVHKDGSSTVWDSTFTTESEALIEAKKFILEESTGDVKH